MLGKIDSSRRHGATEDEVVRLHHRLILIVKFRLKLKKVEKTTRPFRYELNQIPYDYTVEMTK